jgi:RNA polymerase sigma-70 factor (ECF subfamily)
MAEQAANSLVRTEARFEDTHWSVILPAVRHDTPGAEEALARLCRTYWAPLYAFLRKQRHSPEDAKDLTQGFLLHLLSKGALREVDPAQGKFRSFLLGCLGNYLANEKEKARAQKRGGGMEWVSLDDTSHAESGYQAEPATVEDSARIFERRWAATLVGVVFRSLKEEYAQKGKSHIFDTLAPFLNGDAEYGDSARAAATLQMSEVAARVTTSRLRERFREILEEEVARTVSSKDQVADEIAHLKEVLRGS